MIAFSIRSLCPVVLVAAFSLGGCSEAEGPAIAEEEQKVIRLPQRAKEKTDAEVFAESDADGDGRLSSDELPNRFLLKWDLIDANADGYIDADEQYAYLNPRSVQVVVEEKKGDEGSAKQERGKVAQFFAERDADGDGMISMAEAPGKMQERFAALDANSDGFLDANEQEALTKRFKDQTEKRRKQKGKGGGERGFKNRPFGGGGGIEQLFPFDIKGGGGGSFGGGGKKNR